MLALRLARGAGSTVTLRRLLVACASAGVGFLLLTALGKASVPLLLWCVVPMLAAVHFAVAVARADPYARPSRGMSAVAFGPVNVPLLAAVSTLVSCLLGSSVALLLFLHLRGEIAGLPFDGAAARMLGAGGSLPLAAALTLLFSLPVAAAAASAYSLRPAHTKAAPRPAAEADRAEPLALPTPSDLPWGAAMAATGLAIGAYASRSTDTAAALTLPGGFGHVPPAVLGSWGLIALGMVLAGPGLAHLAGRALCVLRPGAVRLLAGRGLQEEARRIGRPLGALAAVVAGVLVAAQLRAAEDGGRLGPIAATGALIVVACAAATTLMAALEMRRARRDTTAALLRLGTSRNTLRAAAALRVAALAAVFLPLAVVVAQLAALPLR
ncbi:hypothetical protein AB0M28_13725 [Streptomyces sp. NPDC051940]|uniref:hypothetical protein n=1 Tax=Streptomyces sp. NPDC051940 TaxID=3155675 RepID=UPI0034131398